MAQVEKKNISFTVTLTASEAKQVEEKVNKLGLELVENKGKGKEDNPFCIKVIKDHDVEAGLNQLDKKLLMEYAAKAYIIDKQSDFRLALRRELGIATERSSGVKQTAIVDQFQALVNAGTMSEGQANETLQRLGIEGIKIAKQ